MPLTVDEVDAAATKLQSAHKGKSTRTGGALLEAAIKKDDLGAVTKLLKDGSKPTPQTLKLALTGCDDRAIAASIVPLSSSWGVDAKQLAIWEAVQEALAPPAGGEDDEAAEAADVTSEEWQVALAQKLYGEEAKAGSPGFYEVKKVVALGVYEGERAAPPDDPTYEPSFDDEKTQRHGYGVLLLPKGDVYVGHFDGGKKAGVGAYVHKSGGGVYVGEWKADKKHGEGRMAFKDGAVYDGSWRHHKRHGRGVYRYVNGDSYVGQWFTGAKRAPPPPPATARHRATAPAARTPQHPRAQSPQTATASTLRRRRGRGRRGRGRMARSLRGRCARRRRCRTSTAASPAACRRAAVCSTSRGVARSSPGATRRRRRPPRRARRRRRRRLRRGAAPPSATRRATTSRR